MFKQKSNHKKILPNEDIPDKDECIWNKFCFFYPIIDRDGEKVSFSSNKKNTKNTIIQKKWI